MVIKNDVSWEVFAANTCTYNATSGAVESTSLNENWDANLVASENVAMAGAAGWFGTDGHSASQHSSRSALYSVDKTAEGYAVFVNTGIKLGILGDSHGRGLAHNNKTGEEIFMRMKEFQAGLGLGIKEYALIFAFIDKTAWDRFISSKVSFGGQADVTADDGVNGGSFEGAVQAAPGTFVYQMTTKGLAAELSLKGTNYYRDKKLNAVEPEKKNPGRK